MQIILKVIMLTLCGVIADPPIVCTKCYSSDLFSLLNLF